jgi:formylglycine-generating enzyme required for sulfatase activity
VLPKLVVLREGSSSLLSPGESLDFASLLASTSPVVALVLSNAGYAPLVGITTTTTSNNFVAVSPQSDSIAAGATAIVQVYFVPSSSGLVAASLDIHSNDPEIPLYSLALRGYGLSDSEDYDSDGLNDAAEFTMSALGFDWQSNQPTLVAALYDNANRAQLFTQLQYDGNRTNGQTDVTTNPSAFNLFTQSQYDDNRDRGLADGIRDGISKVIVAPESYGLYDSTSIMDLRMGGLMIQKQGTAATIVFQPQTTTDLAAQPFTNNGTPVTNTIPMPGNKGFLRVQALAAAPDQMITVQGGPLPQSSQLAGTVVETFRIGKNEVTWGEWQEVRAWATANGYDIQDRGSGAAANYPVVDVMWYDVVKWCNAKSEKELLKPVYLMNGAPYRTGITVPSIDSSANGYRLPTDAEWEWAARGGTLSQGYTYSGSNDLNSVAWHRENTGDKVQAVRTKSPNELGIYDMTGNLWEWVWDAAAVGTDRRIRGGCVSDIAESIYFRVNIYNQIGPDATYGSVGFRLARKAP